MERDKRKKEEGKRKMRFSLSRGKQPERKQTERSVPVKSDLYHGHATHFNISLVAGSKFFEHPPLKCIAQVQRHLV